MLWGPLSVIEIILFNNYTLIKYYKPTNVYLLYMREYLNFDLPQTPRVAWYLF